jgi:hypothetical protein
MRDPREYEAYKVVHDLALFQLLTSIFEITTPGVDVHGNRIYIDNPVS